MLTRRQIPNLLTFARVLAVPVSLGLILFAPQWHVLLLCVFAAASLTDFFDGYLARKWNVTSALGAFLDPVADKLLVALLLLHLMQIDIIRANETGDLYLLPLPVTIIILRELYISGLRECLAARGTTLPVSKGGKLKTALQMLGITAMLMALAYWPVSELYAIGAGCIGLAALVALISAVQYTRASWPHLR